MEFENNKKEISNCESNDIQLTSVIVNIIQLLKYLNL